MHCLSVVFYFLKKVDVQNLFFKIKKEKITSKYYHNLTEKYKDFVNIRYPWIPAGTVGICGDGDGD
jgi:hypothetical protein